MALQLIAPTEVKVGDPIAMSATNSTPETDTFVEYDFQKDGVSVSKGATASYTKAKAALSDAGVWTVVGKKDDEDGTLVTSQSVTIKVDNKQFTNTAEIRLDKPDYKVGDKIIATAWVNNPVEGSTISYSWVINGETHNDISGTAEFTSTKAGTVTFAVSILLQKDGYDPKTITATQGAIVTDGDPAEPEDLNYIHSLPWRESAYLWMGWWVFYEIQKAVEAGIDWKTDQSKLKYATDLKTLAWMLDNYPNIEVQESKNGYILDKSTIESGYIY